MRRWPNGVHYLMDDSTTSCRPDENVVIALDLGGTKLAAAIFAGGRPYCQRTVQLDGRGGDAVGEVAAVEVRRLLEVGAERGWPVRAIGVSTPGIVNARTGRVWAPNIPGWDSFPLKNVLRREAHDAAVKIVVESDRTASILGEAWQGTARGCRDAVFIAVGTGIGAGVLVDGRVVRGANGAAGAIGWMALERPYQPEFDACGCFETYASGAGLARRLASAGTAGGVAASRGDHSGSATASDLFAASDRGDETAGRLVGDAITFWGMASANLVSIFNPAKLIFGGGVFGPAARYLDAIAEEARRWAQPVSVRRVEFAVSSLGPLAALYGAGYLALRRTGYRASALATLGELAASETDGQTAD
jgi:glucokinase